MLVDVSTPFNQASSYEGVLAAILGAYLMCNVNVESLEVSSADKLENLNWLSFIYDKTSFSIALCNEWEKPVGILSLLKWLQQQQKQQVHNVKCFLLKGSQKRTFKAQQTEVFKFICLHAEEKFDAWFRLESGVELPSCAKILSNSWKVDIPMSINLGTYAVSSTTTLYGPDLIFDLSKIIPRTNFNYLSAKLEATESKQILRLEEYNMNENTTLKTSIRLGSLEFKLEELLSLKSGSEVRFTFPQASLVELELAGRIVGRGELRMENGRFVLGVSEVFNRT